MSVKKLRNVVSELLSVLVKEAVSRIGKDLQPCVGNLLLHDVANTEGQNGQRMSQVGWGFGPSVYSPVECRDHEIVVSLRNEDWDRSTLR